MNHYPDTSPVTVLRLSEQRRGPGCWPFVRDVLRMLGMVAAGGALAFAFWLACVVS